MVRQQVFFDPTADPAKDFFGMDQNANWQDDFGKSLKNYVISNIPSIRTLSLFSGAGGLDIGFHDAGFDIVSSVEIEDAFVDTLKANSGKGKYFGESATINCIDIREYNPDFDSVDFIIGGPPCQTFSAAGARAMGVAGTKDERGNLFLEYVRLLKKLKPKGFLFENVYRILGANKGVDWENIVNAFEAAGYRLFHRILDTADYGVPQHRERLIIVGLREDLATKGRNFSFPRPTHGPDSRGERPHYTSQSALCGVTLPPLKEGLGGRYGHLLDRVPPGLNYSYFTEKMGHPTPIFAWRSKFSDFLYKADPDKPVRTIKAQGGQYTGPFHWESRAFAVNELKRLQTFPDSYEILGGKGTAVHQIGNSVPPQFARIMALSILEQVFDVKTPVQLDYLNQNEDLGFRKRKRALSNEYKNKAAEYIKKENPPSGSVKGKDKDIFFDLEQGFSLKVKDGGAYKVSSKMDKGAWILELSSNKEGSDKTLKNKLEIEITPLEKWIVDSTKIKLIAPFLGREAYTAVWKALEYLLRKKNIKADLVQLCGYYQYKPAFRCELKVFGSSSFYPADFVRLLEKVCSGTITRRNLDLSYLSSLCEVEPFRMKEMLTNLKSIGYEIRNSKTNASIDDGIYLIPYPFPTLGPQSVQLKKEL
tara:strand:+ start:138203 stop:140146 length:1944 start_codon:yes stop_codon:yes gene_type:complete